MKIVIVKSCIEQTMKVLAVVVCALALTNILNVFPSFLRNVCGGCDKCDQRARGSSRAVIYH